MKQVRIGLAGLGFMGTTHWGVYKGLKNAKIVALADVDAKKRKGDASAVAALCDWLWDGPEAAEVSSVECRSADPVGYDDFTTG